MRGLFSPFHCGKPQEKLQGGLDDSPKSVHAGGVTSGKTVAGAGDFLEDRSDLHSDARPTPDPNACLGEASVASEAAVNAQTSAAQSACRENVRCESCPLSRMPGGSRVRVRAVHGSPVECSRLYALGITPGAELEVLQENPAGSVISVHDSSLVLCDAVTSRITCELVDSGMRGRHGRRHGRRHGFWHRHSHRHD